MLRYEADQLREQDRSDEEGKVAIGETTIKIGKPPMCYTSGIMKTAVIHVRVEPDTKAKAESVLRRLGLTPAEAIRIFYAQISLRNGLPFPVEVPNDLTAETLARSQRGEDVEQFDSLEEMFGRWES